MLHIEAKHFWYLSQIVPSKQKFLLMHRKYFRFVVTTPLLRWCQDDGRTGSGSFAISTRCFTSNIQRGGYFVALVLGSWVIKLSPCVHAYTLNYNL